MPKKIRPPFPEFPVLMNDRITLRQISAADLQSLIEISFYDGIPAKTFEEALAMNNRINEDYARGNSLHWGIVENSSGEIAGTCGFYRGFENDAGELGCVLLPQFYGKGLMTAALQLACEFGKNVLKLQHIFAVSTSENQKAISLLERLNFVKTENLPEKQVKFELF
ncbi:ribosomal-protein-alanine N-acetyltransferase [Kaistella treverensis]|uniref:Ribosomal-protein-alanine N-acetyltransferase n=1 Tax=Kaistella treverensis TaxID=631455 RepID=A0A1I3J8A3_9FLAO|nr:GNAT family N-acetyltransferase [Kaistella treverensis]SFI56419.1 ribosomal-protein-alanine N-acetyltransferase [Kaistella treverensis]